MPNRKRRVNGEGTIYQRADGLWCGQMVLPSGKRHTVYGKLRRTVVEKLSAARQDPNRLPEAGRMTVEQYLQRWLEDSARPSVRPTTLATTCELSFLLLPASAISPTGPPRKSTQTRSATCY